MILPNSPGYLFGCSHSACSYAEWLLKLRRLRVEFVSGRFSSDFASDEEGLIWGSRAAPDWSPFILTLVTP
jgi:hypothetical protein